MSANVMIKKKKNKDHKNKNTDGRVDKYCYFIYNINLLYCVGEDHVCRIKSSSSTTKSKNKNIHEKYKPTKGKKYL